MHKSRADEVSLKVLPVSAGVLLHPDVRRTNEQRDRPNRFQTTNLMARFVVVVRAYLSRECLFCPTLINSPGRSPAPPPPYSYCTSSDQGD